MRGLRGQPAPFQALLIYMFEFTIAKFGDRKFIANDASKLHNINISYIDDIINNNDICIGDIIHLETLNHYEIGTMDYAIVLIDNKGNKIYRLLKHIVHKMHIGAILSALLEHDADFFKIVDTLTLSSNYKFLINYTFPEIAKKYRSYIKYYIKKNNIKEQQKLYNNIRTRNIIDIIYNNAIDKLGELPEHTLYNELLNNVTSNFEVSQKYQTKYKGTGKTIYITQIEYFYNEISVKIMLQIIENRYERDICIICEMNRAYCSGYTYIPIKNELQIDSWNKILKYDECFIPGILYIMYYNAFSLKTYKGGCAYASYKLKYIENNTYKIDDKHDDNISYCKSYKSHNLSHKFYIL